MLEALKAEVDWLLDFKERMAENLTEMDMEWAELVAGRPVTRLEALELKAEYEHWVEMVERVFG